MSMVPISAKYICNECIEEMMKSGEYAGYYDLSLVDIVRESGMSAVECACCACYEAKSIPEMKYALRKCEASKGTSLLDLLRKEDELVKQKNTAIDDLDHEYKEIRSCMARAVSVTNMQLVNVRREIKNWIGDKL